MKYAVFDSHGFPNAFYDKKIHGDNIPVEAIEITDEQWFEFINNHGRRIWNFKTKQIEVYTQPAPTKDQLLTQLDIQYQPQFQQLQQAWAAAQLDGNTSLAAELQAEYQALKQEYQQKREEIING